MLQKFSLLLDKIIWLSFLALVIITPLLFSTKNTELFEVPKMLFVYLGAIIVLTSTLAKVVVEKKKILPLNAITITFLLFLIMQVLSTLTSIDRFTSIFGYPTRLNGGLLSQFAYFSIFVCALVNLTKEQVRKLILAIIISAFAVALWGIPAHFGYDPNCLILTGNLNATCWQADFNPIIRIFSTMGQPNWLASYLILIIPIATALALDAKNLQKRYVFVAITLTLFIALIFTNSISGVLGLTVSILTFLFLVGINKLQKNLKLVTLLLVPIILVALFFGQSIAKRINESLDSKNQTGPTSSSEIRLIVWRGALQIIKSHPLLGTGPETFAYSYYKVRPLAHNQTTEWNFFYNKAHNEFLNIFANVGILGGISYLLFLIITLITLLKSSSTLAKATFASILGYHFSIFFGFSIVATQMVMFLEIAFLLILSNQTNFKEVNLGFLKKSFSPITLIFISLTTLWLVVFVVRLYFADVAIARAKGLNSNNSQSLLIYSNAISTSPWENPFYLSDTAYATAVYSSSAQDENASKTFASQANLLAQRANKTSSKNIIIARRLANTYILLSNIDSKYQPEAEKLGNLIVNLAPTDPQSYLTQAKVHAAIGKNQQAKESLEKTLELKPNYDEAKELLDQVNKELTILH